MQSVEKQPLNKYVQFFLDGKPGYIITLDKVTKFIEEELEYLEVDDSVELKIIEMTQHKFEHLPEFTGW